MQSAELDGCCCGLAAAATSQTLMPRTLVITYTVDLQHRYAMYRDTQQRIIITIITI